MTCAFDGSIWEGEGASKKTKSRVSVTKTQRQTIHPTMLTRTLTCYKVTNENPREREELATSEMLSLPLSLFFAPLLSAVIAAPSPSPGPRSLVPTIKLDNGTFTGTTDALTGTNRFLGIPFAQPPWAICDYWENGIVYALYIFQRREFTISTPTILASVWRDFFRCFLWTGMPTTEHQRAVTPRTPRRGAFFDSGRIVCCNRSFFRRLYVSLTVCNL